MHSGPVFIPDAEAWGAALQRRAASWWHLLCFATVALVLALSPSTYRRANRLTMAAHLHRSSWEVLPWFSALSALLSLVLIHIVLVSALSYGLSRYALEMVVRVLVLELIPLSAALFVALRTGMVAVVAPGPALLLAPSALTAPALARLQQDLVPRLLAIGFSVLTLAACSSAIALVQAYLMVHGLTLWGLPGFTRTVGHVFSLPVTLGLGLKTLLFSLAVALVPMAAALEARAHTADPNALQPGAVRLFLVLLLIEAASLAVKYF